MGCPRDWRLTDVPGGVFLQLLDPVLSLVKAVLVGDVVNNCGGGCTPAAAGDLVYRSAATRPRAPVESQRPRLVAELMKDGTLGSKRSWRQSKETGSRVGGRGRAPVVERRKGHVPLLASGVPNL